MAKVLIAGCGDVGAHLGLALAGMGHRVFGLRRHPEGLSPPIEPLAGDLGRPESLELLPRGLDFVFYAAAAEGFSEPAYRLAYVDGVNNLLHILGRRGEGIERFFFASSTAVFGQADGGWVDENSPVAPTHFSGQCKLAGERAVLSGPFPGTVLRLGGIYGPGRNRLVEGVRRGDSCIADPPVYTNRIHRDDCSGAFVHLLGLSDPDDIYVGVDEAPAPQCEVMDWLASRLGVPVPARVSGADASSPQRGNKRCSSRRLVSSGFRFRYPTYREGYAALLAGG